MIRAGVAHAAILAAIHAEAFPPQEAWGAAAMAGVLGMAGVFGFVDERGGLVLGRLAADEGEILTLGVLPSARRQGLGRALLQRAIAEAESSVWFLEVSAANTAALCLYRAAGFAECGRRRGYYATGQDALLLKRPCGPAAPRISPFESG